MLCCTGQGHLWPNSGIVCVQPFLTEGGLEAQISNFLLVPQLAGGRAEPPSRPSGAFLVPSLPPPPPHMAHPAALSSVFIRVCPHHARLPQPQIGCHTQNKGLRVPTASSHLPWPASRAVHSGKLL